MIIQKIKEFFRSISIDCFAVCLYFVCLPFTIVTTPFGSLLKVITYPVVAVLVYKLLFGKRMKLAFNGVQLIYSIYVLYVFLSLFISRDENAMVTIKDMMLSFFVMMLIVIRVYSEKERHLIESSWIAVGVICAYLCLTSSSVANEYENRTIVYIFGFAEDPNQFCAYFIMPVMVCLRRIMVRRKTTPLYVVLIILILYSVMKTGSRGGLIGIVAGIFICVLLAAKSIKSKLIMVGALIAGAVFIVLVIFPLLPSDIQLRYSIQSVVEDNGAGRFNIWEYLVSYTLEKPERMIFGSGILSSYRILAGALIPVAAGAAHNQYVQVFCDQGIIGLLIFFFVIPACFFRNRRKEPYYASAFIAVMAFSMSLTLYVFKPYINIIIMCAMNFAKEDGLQGREVEYESSRKITGHVEKKNIKA